GGSRAIHISDLTLQGGNNGLHLDPVGTGTIYSDTLQPVISGYDAKTGLPNYARAQYVGCFINHVTFRNMANAGIHFDKIYAIDNNIFSYLNFVSCGTGILQTADSNYNSGDAGGDPYAARMMYIDKVLFYRCQFVNGAPMGTGTTGLAMDLINKRGSNLNAWVNCLFKNNTGGVANMIAWINPSFSNCDFVNNGANSNGAALSNNGIITLLSCDFNTPDSGTAPATSIVSGSVTADGCLFASQAATSVVKSSTVKVYFHNCMSAIPLWSAATNINGGVFTNNSFAQNTALNVMAASVVGTTQTTLVPTASAATPQQQILWGSNWTTGGGTYGNAPLLLPARY
ncbi:MAG: hypothetical protein PHE72_14835, partial [candidate division Zixibacteria bacterium]|nr:hypothetical protein [candidate division Zixibacteria bacterium]